MTVPADNPNSKELQPQGIFQLLGRLWHHLSKRRQHQIELLIVLMILASFAEILSIGSVLPFLAVLTDPNRVFGLPILQPLIQILGITNSAQLILPLTILFGLAAIFAGGMRLLLLWTSTRVSFAAGADLSYGIYERTLYQDYAVHISRNSSVVIDGILIKTNSIIFDGLMSAITLVSSLVMLVLILGALIWVDPQTSILAFVGFGLIYVVVLLATKKQLKENSAHISSESQRVIKTLQEGLGGIRDILIDGSQEEYCKAYQRADRILRRSQGSNSFMIMAPRFAVEAIGMLFIAALAYFITNEGTSVARAIPILGALALGAQRLVPILQQAYASWASIKGSQGALVGSLELMDQPLPKHLQLATPKPIGFQHSIVLSNLGFAYSPTLAPIFQGLNLSIAKGSRLGVIGATGCGKSTLLDIIMGLLPPTTGQLIIDGKNIDDSNRRAWQLHIAHVPQAIYLSDSSIAENIAFGVPLQSINLARVREAAAQAQILNLIDSWPNGLDTEVGERGVRLSGGQRQRIGIARALYKKADVIIFDEATSALDNDTEETLIQTIANLDAKLTIITIAHRLTTLRNCTQIIELEKGVIVRTCQYADLTID
ncbi:ABC transporter ATP-binding protein/permease [Polynucleobacter sp. IMCC30063]|uniref:ABC transporter ATP-binding protein n=1 Tax=Polynucleobacter sp. IMCC30063 TaxID=2907298 RepID=UPI001F2BA48B|nr:ABC transporter ATP-binding protein [Polynucleobacter sp. IMCC30063]MCE7505311.1 ABC transporter ATP-binding protein/permease [Polynucleobacter sp. IMCC30063]